MERFQWQFTSGCWEPITEAEPLLVGFCLSSGSNYWWQLKFGPCLDSCNHAIVSTLPVSLLLLLLPLSLINRCLPWIYPWKKKSFWCAAPFYTSADQCFISPYKVFSKLRFGIFCSLKSISVPVNGADAWAEQCLFGYIFWGGGLFVFLSC